VTLPFLVVHGAIVWKLAVVGLVAASFGVAYALRRRTHRRSVRAELAVLTKQLESPRSGPIILRGRVVTGTLTSVQQRASWTDLAKAVTLDCDGAMVEIVGAIRVEQGTRVRTSWRKPAITRTVSAGDEVIATGTLEPAPPEASSYREATPRWALSPKRLLAVNPMTAPFPLKAGQRAVRLVAWTGVWLATLALAGNAMLHGVDARATARDGVLPELGRLELAAALPGSRDGALEGLREQLVGYRIASSERAFQLDLQLAEIRADCPAMIFMEQVRLDDALVAARRCGSHDDVTTTLVLLGRYDEAERELEATDVTELATTIHIAAGNWTAAARGVEASARALEAEIPSEYRTKELLHDGAATRHCLAALMESYAGDHTAFANIENDTAFTCPMLAALAKPFEQQAAALAAVREPKTDAPSLDDTTYVLAKWSIQLAVGDPPARYFAEGVSSLMFLRDRERVWLAPSQLAVHRNDAYTAIAEQNMTAVAALRGDLRDARSHLAHVRPGYEHDELELALALDEGLPITATAGRHAGFDDSIALRNGKLGPNLESLIDDRAVISLLERALAGDGSALVAMLNHEGISFDVFAMPMLGILPRITSHRDEVASALRLFRDELTGFSLMRIPFHALGNMIMYRDLARLVGDAEDTQRWQLIIDRHAAVLGDRRKAMALMLWRD